MSVIIIAEAGVNHNADINLAFALIDAAVDAGADIIKFQTCLPEEVVTASAEKARYQLETTDRTETQLEMTRKIHLDFDSFLPLKKYCDQLGIEFLTSAFGMNSLAFIETLGLKRFKVPSGEITNYPYVERIASHNKPTIVSTGLCNMDEVEAAVDLMQRNGLDIKKNLTLLICNTAYPTPPEDVNLLSMDTLTRKFGCNVGFSDHTQGTLAAVLAAAKGASVIEKHFTLSRLLPGPDHRASCEPHELKNLITTMKSIPTFMGKSDLQCSASESENKAVARKSVVASSTIHIGDVFNESNLTTKRPLVGVPAENWFKLIGRTAKKNYNFDDHIDIQELI